MIPEPGHHPHRYMNSDGYAYGCCGKTHVYSSRKGRDKALADHEAEYLISHPNQKLATKTEKRG
jgi:hypothetical protein